MLSNNKKDLAISMIGPVLVTVGMLVGYHSWWGVLSLLGGGLLLLLAAGRDFYIALMSVVLATVICLIASLSGYLEFLFFPGGGFLAVYTLTLLSWRRRELTRSD